MFKVSGSQNPGNFHRIDKKWISQFKSLIDEINNGYHRAMISVPVYSVMPEFHMSYKIPAEKAPTCLIVSETLYKS